MRPFILSVARELKLQGWVCNTPEGVSLLAQGHKEHLECLVDRLRNGAPPLARITRLHRAWVDEASCQDFVILPSHMDTVGGRWSIPADTAVCMDCLEELFDPLHRRWRHPFISCTQCGPRHSLLRSLPYDRVRTSMAGFPLCAECSQEYADPSNRRFHAQPIACLHCGPRLWAASAQGQVIAGDPLSLAWKALRQGEILAVKGVGGFHLVCDARNAKAVARLRQRKRRPHKPFAVMAANSSSLENWLLLEDADRAALQGPAAPIVLLSPRSGAVSPLAAEVAQGMPQVGVMLPHSPLHWLLFHEAAEQPWGTSWLQQPQSLLLVMTSANLSGAPLVTDNDQALQQLSGLADLWLLHDRTILNRLDDSLIAGHGRGPVRLGRGMAPLQVPVIGQGPSVLALGGQLKNSLCLLQGSQALLSQHLGDLQHPDTCRALEAQITQWQELLDMHPDYVACDLHPDFFSSTLAEQLAAVWQRPLVRVQHHHAHAAAVMAEWGVRGPVLALVLDGLGWGDDGMLRGGELLQVTATGASRLGALVPLVMPGGEVAAREPWRLAAAVLHALGRADEIAVRFADQPGAKGLAMLLQRGFNCPPTTSLGRLFDAAAGLLGLCTQQSFEAEAALRLEALVRQPVRLDTGQVLWRLVAGDLDFLPLLAALVDSHNPEQGAELWHAALIFGLTEWVVQAAQKQGLTQVVLAGGCLLNRHLYDGLQRQLSLAGVEPLLPKQVPINDAGLAVGQAWAVRLQHE